MRTLNVRLLLWSLGGVVALGLGVGVVHWLQSGRIAQAILNEAQLAEDQGRIDQTLVYLGRYLEFQPRDLTQRARLSRLLASDRFASSRKIREMAYFNLEQVLNQEPDHDDLRRLLVRVTMDLRRFEEAKEQLDALVKARADDGDTERLYAQWYEAQGKFAVAVDWYRKAVRHAPTETDNYVHLAHLLRQRLDPARKAEHDREADKLMDEMAAHNDRSFAAYLARWRYRKTYGSLDTPARIKEAGADVVRALELAPKEIDVLLAAANLAQLQGELDKARAHLDQGFQLHPLDARLYQARAKLEYQAGNRPEAMETLRRGLQTVARKDQIPLLSDLAEMLIDAKDLAKAGEVLGQLRKGNASPALAEYIQGRILFSQGGWAEAAKSFERVRAAWEGVPELTIQVDRWLGQCYAELGEPARQLTAWKRVVSQDAGSIPAQLKLAAAQLAAGHIDEAVEQYRQVAALPNAPAGAWNELARLLIYRNLQREQPDWAEVEDVLTRAEKAQPQAVEPAILRAEMLNARNQPDQALEILTQLRDRQPRRMEIWLALANLAERQGKGDQARQMLEEGEKRAGASTELQLAWMRYWGNHPGPEADGALAKLKQDLAAVKKEDRPRLLQGLAGAFYRQGKTAEAEELWDRLTHLPGYENHLQIRNLLFELALQRGDQEKMRQRLDNLRRVEGGSGPLSRFGEASRLIWLGGRGEKQALDEARVILDGLSAQRPDWSVLPVAKGDIEDLKGNPDEAIANFRRAIALGDRSARVSRRLIQLLYQRGRYDEADREFRTLQQQAPVTADLQRLAVDVSLRTQDPARAVELARQTVLADSKDYQDFLFLGRVLAATGQRAEEAEGQLRRAVELAPAAPETWLTLVQHLAASGHKDKAEEVIRQARVKLPPEQAALTLALCYEEIGQAEEAVGHYRQALAAKPEDFFVLRNVAAYFLRRGPSSEAELILRKMLDPRLKGAESETGWARRNLAFLLAGTHDYRQFSEALTLLELGVEASGNVVVKEKKTGEEGSADERMRARVLATRPERSFRTKAVAILEELQSQQTLSAEDQHLLAQLYEKDGAWPKARTLLRNLLADHGTTAPFLRDFVQALVRHAETEEAHRLIDRLEEMEKAQKAEPGALGTVALRALVWEAQGEGAKGAALLQAHAARPNARPEDLLMLAEYLGRQKRLDEAMNCVERAGPKVAPEAVCDVLWTLIRSTPSGDSRLTGRVERRLQAAIGQKPRAPLPLLRLAGFYDLQGNHVEADKAYRRVLDVDGDNLEALNNLAWSLTLNSGKAGAALPLIERAIQIGGPLAAFRDTRAVVYLTLGKGAPAVADALAAVGDAPSAARYFHLAQAHQLTGDQAAARQALQKAQKLGLAGQQLHPAERPALQKMMNDLVTAK